MATIPAQTGKLALVTGANRGLGFEIALALAQAGANVILACRDGGKAQAAAIRIQAQHPAAVVQAMTLDVADLESVRRFADEFRTRHERLDLLIHNAGAVLVPQSLTKDGFETHLGTNVLGPYALTGRLLDRLEAAPAARIVSMASIAHRMTQGFDANDPQLTQRPYDAMDAYGRSKLAVLLYTRELDRRLRQAGARTIATAAHPGYAATNVDLGGFFMRLSTRLFAQPAARGALPALHAATAAEVRGGDYYGPGGLKELRGAPKRVGYSAAAGDDDAARALWSLAQGLTGVRYLD